MLRPRGSLHSFLQQGLSRPSAWFARPSSLVDAPALPWTASHFLVDDARSG
jgi:hypothetical protein